MKRGFKWLGIGLGAVVGLVLVAAIVMYAVGSSRIGRTYEAQTANLLIAQDAEAVSRGGHLANINGCTDCHGPNLAGQVFVDEPPFRVVAPNLTRGRGGVGGQYTAATFDRAIRHGIGYDGRGLLIMPSAAFHKLSDRDAADLIAYLSQVPPVDNELPTTEIRPLGRVLASFAIDPTMEVNTTPARSDAPAPGRTAEYGAYLTSITCAYCHGADLRGGQPPEPGSPPAPDLASAGQWPSAAFAHTLRTGQTPGGRQLDPKVMPWTFTKNMSDDEIAAIHAHLGTLIHSAPQTTVSSN